MADEDQLEIWAQVLGLQRATSRLMTGGTPMKDVIGRITARIDEDLLDFRPFDEPVRITDLYTTLFEACSWTASLDKRLREELAPDWWQHTHDGHLARGIRYVRNAVHHDWSDVIELPERDGPMLRTDTMGCTWRDTIRSRNDDRTGEEIYREYFAGECMIITFLAVTVAYLQAINEIPKRS